MAQASSTSDISDKSENPRSSSLGRLAILILLAGILLFLGWFGWKAWRLYQTGSSLLARQTEAEQLLKGGWSQADPDAVEALVLGVRGDFVSLRQDIGFVLPLLPYLSQIPQVGSLAAAAPYLFEMADAGTEAAAYGVRGMKPALIELQNEERSVPLLPLVVETVDLARPDLAQASIALDQAAAARAKITDVAALPWRVRTLLELGDKWLPLGQKYVRMALVLPEIMGAEGPRRYLILAQNEDELRPSGGFLSGAGYVEVLDGRVTSLDFIDANMVDAWEKEFALGGKLLKPYSEPPLPLKEFMFLDLFLFRDANFWPDFAVSAQKAMDLYVYGRDVPALDGAVGIDQQFLKLLLEGIGPVGLGDGEMIRGSNVIESLQESWTLQDGVVARKAFLGPFAAAILSEIEGGLSDIDPLSLSQNLNLALDRKDLQVYMRDSEAAAVLAANDWDGRLYPPINHDTLMTVDTNMGYNKANYSVDRAVSYEVRLGGEGESVARLAVTHKHRGQPSTEQCWQGTAKEYTEGADYLALTDKCYFNYLRVYVPEGSELISGPENLIPGQTWFGGYDWQPPTETVAELPGYATFASWMLLPQGDEQTSEFVYNLPGFVIQTIDGTSSYTLELLKQAGVEPYIVHVTVTPPAGTEIVEVFPAPLALEGDALNFAIELDKDQIIALTFRQSKQ